MNARPYQLDATNRIVKKLGEYRSTIAVLPTGTGKTYLMGLVTQRMDARTLVIAHREELVRQNAEEIEGVTGEHVYIEMADERLSDADLRCAKIVSASVQTLIAGDPKRMTRFGDTWPGLVVFDECHAAISPSWLEVASYFKNSKILGLTATPMRGDGLSMANAFESVAYEYWITDAIADGWLVPLRFRRCKLEGLDTSLIKYRDGDFTEKSLREAFEEEEPMHRIADGVLQHAGDRKTIVFVPSVACAKKVDEILDRHKPGSSVVVHAKTDDDVRLAANEGFKNGNIQYYVNVGIASHGFNAPRCACIAIARLTASIGLFTQMIGRGTRTLKGVVDGYDSPDERMLAIAASAKPYCLILEFTAKLPRPAVSVIDVMAGSMDPDILARARALAGDRDGEIDPRALVTDVRADLEAKYADAEQASRVEKIRRRGIIVKGIWSSFEHDPIGTLGLKIRDDKWAEIYDGQPLSIGQVNMLERMGIKNVRGMSLREQRTIFRHVIKRINSGHWTMKQEILLKSRGYSGPVLTKDAASQFIDKLLGTKPWQRTPREATT